MREAIRGGGQGVSGGIRSRFYLKSGMTSMSFDHFNSCLGILFDVLMRLLIGGMVVVWFLREGVIDIGYSSKIVSGDIVGAKVKGIPACKY